MSRNGFVERPLGLGNFVVLLAAIWLSLATWVCFASPAPVPAWKPWLSVALAVVLALGSLTPDRAWELRLRAAAGLWVLAAPFLLRFLYITPARWAYFGTGVALLVAATPDRLRPRRLPTTL